ncbi:MAG: hypothetical protein HUJ60_01560 [Bacilli bacterium]|nr:hypothetical protein [Bacilli bacterium]
MKKLKSMILGLAATMLLASCGGNAPEKSSSDQPSKPEESSSIAPEESSSQTPSSSKQEKTDEEIALELLTETVEKLNGDNVTMKGDYLEVETRFIDSSAIEFYYPAYDTDPAWDRAVISTNQGAIQLYNEQHGADYQLAGLVSPSVRYNVLETAQFAPFYFYRFGFDEMVTFTGKDEDSYNFTLGAKDETTALRMVYLLTCWEGFSDEYIEELATHISLTGKFTWELALDGSSLHVSTNMFKRAYSIDLLGITFSNFETTNPSAKLAAKIQNPPVVANHGTAWNTEELEGIANATGNRADKLPFISNDVTYGFVSEGWQEDDGSYGFYCEDMLIGNQITAYAAKLVALGYAKYGDTQTEAGDTATVTQEIYLYEDTALTAEGKCLAVILVFYKFASGYDTQYPNGVFLMQAFVTDKPAA